MRIFSQRMNKDVAETMLQPTECRSKTNLRSGLVSGSNAMSNENLLSNVLIPSAYYETNDVVIGSCEDISNDSIIFNVYNPDATKNKILRYFPFDSDRVELVLKHEYLGYKEDYKITQHNVISGLYYWVFGYFNTFLNNDYNPPRKINLEKAKKFTDNLPDAWEFLSIEKYTYNGTDCTRYVGQKSASWSNYEVGDNIVAWANEGDSYGYRFKPATGYCHIVTKTVVTVNDVEIETDRPWTYTGIETELNKTGYILLYQTDMYFGIDWQVLDRAKHPPLYRPSVSYANDTTRNSNNMRSDLFQVAYRWIYDDKETSVFSPSSDIAIPTSLESMNGSSYPDPTIDNKLNIWVDNGSMEVTGIDVAIRKGNIGDWVLIERRAKFDKDGEVIYSSDVESLVEFYNTEVGESLSNTPESQEFRQYDFVPIVSSTQELIEKNRLSDHDYREGFDNIDIDVSLTSTQSEVVVGKVGGTITTIDFEPKKMVGAMFIGLGLVDFKYYGGWIYWGSFYQTGYTYVVNISATPGKYNNPHNISGAESFLQLTYGDYYEKNISASATVEATNGMLFSDFCDSVVLQLRNGSSFGKVIGLNNYNYKTFGTYLEMYDLENGIGSDVVPDGYLGFVIEYAGPLVDEDWEDCINCEFVEIDILKLYGNTVVQSFKSGAFHDFGLVYKDRAGRRSAVQKSVDTRIYIPSQTDYNSNHQIYKNTIGWTINHIPPLEAVSYQWVYSKNTSISYFLYASIQAISNVPQTLNIATSNCTSICVNEYIVETAEVLTKFNVRPYEWQAGDRLRFLFNRQTDNTYTTISTYLDYEILGIYYADGEDGYMQDNSGATDNYIRDVNGNRVRTVRGATLLIEKINYPLYGIDADTTIVEIYRPKKASDNLSYFDFYDALPVINPHTSNRYHGGTTYDQNAISPATGIFDKGDVYLAFRTMHNAFPVERYNFSDFFNSECFGIGSTNMEDINMSFKRYISYVRYSQILIENSLTNGLSTNYGSEFDVIPQKYGAIYSAKELGEVLRVLQKSKATSIYIGKGEMKQPIIGDSGVVAISPSVIGSKRYHTETFGTVFPESVVNSNNFTYFFDIYNSAYVRWATNGLQQIVRKETEGGWDYGMGVYFRDKCTALLNSGIDNVKVYAVYEKEYENLIVTFVDSANPENDDTIVFHEPSNSWTMHTSFIPEFYGTNKKVLVMAKDGQLWKANAGTDRNTFFGVPYKSEIEVVGHEEPDKNYVFNDMAIVTNSDNWSAPNTGDVSVNIIGGQMKSRLKNGRFVNREGVMVATFGKDMTTSGVERIDDLVAGRELRGHAVRVRLENDSTDEVILTAIDINSTESE